MRRRPAKESEPRPRPVSTTAGALWREFEAIHGEAQTAALGQGPDASLRAYYTAALDKQQAALCLSGGGIRSGAFALGVLQALAKARLLSHFHYVSTVSGGGYIGGWLMATLRNHAGDVEQVQDLLAAGVSPPVMTALRRFTSYLTPNPGLFSPDTWAAITLWVRNVLINWLIFFPALLALALLPGLYLTLINAVRGGGVDVLLLCVALLGLGIAVFNGTDHLPGLTKSAARGNSEHAWFVPLWIVLPMMVWVTLVPLVVAPWLRQVMPEGALSGDIVPILGFLVMEAAAVAAAFIKDLERRPFWRNFCVWTLAALASSVLLWVWLDLAIGAPPMVIAIFGPLAVASAHIVLTLVFVALRVETNRGELDREWLARLSAEKLAPSLIWATFAAICLFLPWLVLDHWDTRFKPLVLAVWTAAGPIAAYLGKMSKDEPGTTPDPSGAWMPSLSTLTNVIAVIFGAAIFMLLARLVSVLTGDALVPTLILLVIAVLLAFVLGHRINVNRFSMHAVYRNRLVRAFLGSARPIRNPDPFTGMDPRDNPRMTDLFQRRDTCHTLFPVINVTLNLVSGRNTAWAERKAESFTMTPLSCGGAYLHRAEDIAAGLPPRGAYVMTADYAGNERETGPGDPGQGVTLGTAITLSGAAVSPSMGYHSSPAMAFLMTLFNVRLGAWLPNPAVASTHALERAKPPNALISLLRELLGRTNDLGRDVYLSDGGHFENLGIYEMIRRRCRYILAIDAGEDPDAHFQDLGDAVRKIRIDFGVDIVFDPPVAIGSRHKPVTPFLDYACATIRYPEAGAPTGYLIYLKPSYPRYIAMDVRAYGNDHSTFPHESTTDQFFSESQFESYRQLGEMQTSRLADAAATIPALFAAAHDRIKRFTPGSGDGIT
jgi:hypothetical protein